MKGKSPRLVHKGFGSDQPVYYQDEILAEYGVTDETADLDKLSIRQMHSIRKYILELTRTYPEITGYNITAIVDVPITSSGVFAEGMVPKLAPEAMQKINGEIVVSFSKDLGRIWKNGGDRFLAKDLYNYFSADDLAGRLVLSNHKGMDLNGTYEVSLVSGNDVYFRQQKYSLKYQVGESF